MSEELQQNLRNQLWEVANKLRGIGGRRQEPPGIAHEIHL